MIIVIKEYTINDTVWQYIKDSNNRRYSPSEALSFLIQHTKENAESAFQTSVNKLAKQWRWDNHQVDNLLLTLAEDNVLLVHRNSKSIAISLTDDFIMMSEKFQSLFSIISTETKKATKLEAFVYLLDNGVSSYRSVAKELGWSHHSVMRLVSFLRDNGITISGACTTNDDLGRNLEDCP